MQARPQHQLDGFQVHGADLVALGKDTGQQQVYFLRNFLMDRSSRFFSWASSQSLPSPPDEARRSFG